MHLAKSYMHSFVLKWYPTTYIPISYAL
jgi:hypothetical protein